MLSLTTRTIARGMLSKSIHGSFLCSKSATKATVALFGGRFFSAQVAMDETSNDHEPSSPVSPRPVAANAPLMEKKLYTFHPGLSNQCTIIDSPIISPHITTRLFLHHIPPNAIDEVGIAKIILSLTSVHPIAVEQIDYSKKFGWTYVDFRSKQHADLAFDSLQGRAAVDKSDRPQKRLIITKTGDYLHVRKNTRLHLDKEYAARAAGKAATAPLTSQEPKE